MVAVDRLGICHMRHPRVGDLYLDRNSTKFHMAGPPADSMCSRIGPNLEVIRPKRLSISLPLRCGLDCSR